MFLPKRWSLFNGKGHQSTTQRPHCSERRTTPAHGQITQRLSVDVRGARKSCLLQPCDTNGP